MKKIIAILISMMLLLGAFVSCNNLEDPGSSSSESSSSSSEESSKEESSEKHNESTSTQASSKLFHGKWDYENKTKETVNGVTAESFDGYADIISEYLGSSYKSLAKGEFSTKEYFVKIFSSYDEFSEGVINNSVFNTITVATFESNYVLVVEGESGHVRSEICRYSDLVKKDGKYFLTYNLISYLEKEFSDALQHYTDIVIIPKSLFEDDISDIELKVIKKIYDFKGAAYDSECVLTTYLPVIP